MALDNTTFLRANTTNNETIKSSEPIILGPNWGFMEAFYIVTAVCSCLTNGTVLYTILTRRRLRTSFNFYLINHLTANILMVNLQNIPHLFSHLYTGWILGEAYCSVFIFGLYVFEAGIKNCHSIIAFNRIWAVFWPHHYRTHHSKRTAVLLIIAAWLEIGAMILPGYIPNVLWYRQDARVYGCTFDFSHQMIWSIFVQFVVYDSGVAVPWVAFPLIYFKTRQIRRTTPGSLAKTSQTKRTTGGNETTVMQNTAVIPKEPVKVTDGAGEPGKTAAPKAEKSSNSVKILAFLTVSVTICWTPSHTVYTVMMWVDFVWFNTSFMAVCTMLSYTQSIVDPILFCLALPELGEAVKKMLRGRQSASGVVVK